MSMQDKRHVYVVVGALVLWVSWIVYSLVQIVGKAVAR